LEEKIIAIADDLTGANEIASIAARKGKKSVVLNASFKGEKIEKLFLNEYEGMIFNLDSRNLSEENAYRRVKDFLTNSREIAKKLIYKKIDSTLRGNVAKEIDAVLDSECFDAVILVPALPRMERITVGGYHLVKGIPLGRTFYAQDFTVSHLQKLLRSKSKYKIGHVDLHTIELGAEAIFQKIIKEYREGLRILICDCCTRDDLKNIKEAIFNLNLRVLPVGSAGFFEELLEDKMHSLPSLIICGSLNRITRAQLNRLIDVKKSGYLEIDFLHLLSEDKRREFKRLLGKGEIILNQGKDLIIATPQERFEVEKKQDMNKIKLEINQFLASLAKYFIKNFHFSGVIATGGSTAMAFLISLDVNKIEIVDELEPLIPVGVIRSSKRERMHIITKTGGFGSEDVFLKAVEYLKRKRSKRI